MMKKLIAFFVITCVILNPVASAFAESVTWLDGSTDVGIKATDNAASDEALLLQEGKTSETEGADSSQEGESSEESADVQQSENQSVEGAEGIGIDDSSSAATEESSLDLLAAGSDFDTSKVYIIKSLLGTTLDITGASSASGANLQTFVDNNTPAQRFRLSKTSDGYYTFVNVASGKVLDVQYGLSQSGANVWQYDNNASLAQKFSIVETGDGDGAYYLVSALSSASSQLCLDVAGASVQPGANVQLWVGNETKAQKFEFVPQANPLADGYYTIASSVAVNKTLDISSASASNGANLHIWTANSTAAQRFQLAYNTNDGYYTIYCVVSSKTLDVAGAGTGLGANVWQYAANNTPAQRWSIEENGDGYRIRSGCSGLSLDVSGGSSVDGSNVQMWEANTTAAQRWTFTETKPIDEGVYLIQSALGKVLDATGGGSANGTKIQTYSSNGTFAQKYQLKYVEDGYYSLLAINADVAIDVASASTANGARVQLYESNGSAAQLWKPLGAGGGYFVLQSKSGGKVIDIAAASTANEARVQMYDVNGTNAQRFQFVTTQLIPNASYTLQSALSANMVVDVESASANNGAKLQLYTSNNTLAQKFTITYLGDGYYSLSARCSNKALDVKDATIDSSGNGILQQWEFYNNTAQKWKAQVAGGGYFFFVSAVNAGSCINVTSSVASNGVTLNVAKKTDATTQKFKLVPVTTPISDELALTLDTMTQLQQTNPHVSAGYSEIHKVLNPLSYAESSREFFQFADLRGYGGMTAAQLDFFIDSTSAGRTGMLHGQGAAFVEAAQKYKVNEVYLLAHAILESGWGTSTLAKGQVKGYEGYYNFYGIGAHDLDPLNGGAALAKQQDWNTQKKAILGAAYWISLNYTYRTEYPQITLYNMKWDYKRSNDTGSRGWHQYATDIAWPSSIARLMGSCYSQAGIVPSLIYIVPKYK